MTQWNSANSVSRKVHRGKGRIPFREAVAIAGSEEALLSGRPPATRSQYKTLGVPVSQLAPHLLDRWRARSSAGDSVEPIDHSESVPEVAQLLEVIHADAALDPFTGLPGGPGARQRYRERLADVEQKLAAYAEELMRGLKEYEKLLIAEARAPKGQR